MGQPLAFEAESIGSLYPDSEVVTVFYLASGTSQNAANSYVLVEGYPTDGDLPQTALDPPTVVAPEDTIPFDGAVVSWDPAGVAATGMYAADQVGSFVFFTWPSNVSSVTLPAMPTDASPFSGVGLLTASLRHEEGSIAGGELYERVSVSSPFRFTQ